MPPISAAHQEPYEDNMDPEIHAPCSLEREKCPVCGNSWPERLYVDDWGMVVGCDECISVRYLD